MLGALARVEARSAHAVSSVVSERVGVLLPGTTLIVITASTDSALPDALARYTSAQTRVGVICLDPAAVSGGARRAPAEESRRFIAEPTRRKPTTSSR